MPFRQPDCLLVRVGELALKSDPVQFRMFNMLLDNMRAALKGINFKLEIMRNRMFVYTSETKKATRRLQRVFGIVSVSPAWVCHSELEEIKLLTTDLAEKVLRLGPRKSFAIRPHRVGEHPFTTKTLAEEAGAAVKKVTDAKVNLSKPVVEIFVETRSDRTYIFSEKVPCAGGLPLGSSGKALALVDGTEAAVAAWLIMKRGVELVLLTDKKPLAASLRRWHIGRRLQIFKLDVEKLDEIAQKFRVKAVVGPARLSKRFENRTTAAHLTILQPTAGWSAADIRAVATKIGLN